MATFATNLLYSHCCNAAATPGIPQQQVFGTSPSHNSGFPRHVVLSAVRSTDELSYIAMRRNSSNTGLGGKRIGNARLQETLTQVSKIRNVM